MTSNAGIGCIAIINQDGAKDLIAVIQIAAPAFMCLLLVFSAYLYVKNETLEIKVTDACFNYIDPLFNSVSFNTPP